MLHRWPNASLHAQTAPCAGGVKQLPTGITAARIICIDAHATSSYCSECSPMTLLLPALLPAGGDPPGARCRKMAYLRPLQKGRCVVTGDSCAAQGYMTLC